MNKIIKITITFLLFSVLLQAQPTTHYFNKVFPAYNSDTINLLSQVIRPVDGGYVVMGNFGTISRDGLYIQKIDSIGNPVWFTDFVLDNGLVDVGILREGSSVVQLADQNLVVAYNKNNHTETGHDIYLSEVNVQTGEKVWTHSYPDSLQEAPSQVIKTIDGGFAIGGIQASDTGQVFYLIKTNPVGQFQWKRTYKRGNDAKLFSVQQWWDGTYIMGGWGWNGTDYDMWVVKTTANGDTLWTKALGGAYNDCAASVSFLTTWEDWYFNNAPVTYLVEGCYYVEVTFPIEQVVSKQYVAKLTEDGNTLLWEHKYLNPDLFLLSSLQTMPIIYPDGSFLGVAGYYNQDFPDEGFYAAVLMKFRSNGTVEWYKKFYPENTFAEAYLKDLQRTPDGGYVMAGYQYNPSPQKGWVLKLDEEFNTCSFVGCDSTIYTGYPIGLDEVLLNKAAFSLIPNPAQDVVTIQLPNISTEPLSLTICDISGRLVQTIPIQGNTTTISTQQLATGMYLCKLSNSSQTQKLVIIR